MGMVNRKGIPWENAGADTANEAMVPPITHTHAMVTTQNARLELIYRECVRWKSDRGNEVTDFSQNTTTRMARTSERGQ